MSFGPESAATTGCRLALAMGADQSRPPARAAHQNQPPAHRPRCRQVLARPAYQGCSDFNEALHVPSLPPPDFTGQMSLLLPLVDVSGSMHTKLKTATTQICEQFLNKTDVNTAGMMAFTTEPFLICPPSGMHGPEDKQEFRRALDSLFIPSHSGTDIPAAVLRYLQFARDFLHQVPSRNELEMWKANCVIITDGLHNVQEEKWEQMEQAVLSTRSSAKSKHCYLFFFLLNLQSKDVDEAVLSRLSQVLRRAERALRTKGLQPEQVYDKISSHMVTLEKCITQFTEVKKRFVSVEREEKTGLKRKMLQDGFALVKVSLKKHQEEAQCLQEGVTFS